MSCKITVACSCTLMDLPQLCVCVDFVLFDAFYHVTPSAVHLPVSSFNDSYCINYIMNTKDCVITTTDKQYGFLSANKIIDYFTFLNFFLFQPISSQHLS